MNKYKLSTLSAAVFALALAFSVAPFSVQVAHGQSTSELQRQIDALLAQLRNQQGLPPLDVISDSTATPSITSITPKSIRGDKGTVVTIKGKNFLGSNPVVGYVNTSNGAMGFLKPIKVSDTSASFALSKLTAPGTKKVTMYPNGATSDPSVLKSNSVELVVTGKRDSKTKSVPIVTITSPEVGETWKIGETYPIKWKVKGNLATRTIHLVSETNGVRIDKSLGNTNGNAFKYEVSSLITPPGDYTLWVCGKYCPYSGEGIGSGVKMKIE